MKRNALVFDMDGTIADFYGVDGWLTDLVNENTRPYEIAKPLVDMDILTAILNVFKTVGYDIIVTSWGAKNSSDEFLKATTKAKIDWLNKVGFPYDEVNVINYGVSKNICTENTHNFQILIDDNAEVRNDWKLGLTIDATKNIINILSDFLVKTLDRV